MKYIFIIILLVFYGNLYGQTTYFSHVKDIPEFLLNKGTNLKWILTKKQSDIVEKKRIIKSIQSAKGVLFILDSVYNISEDSIARISFLTDLNLDSINDFILYGFLPFCNFQPYIFIAINDRGVYQPIFQGEGDLISWQSTQNSRTFQIFVHGSCGDSHGYLYNFSGVKGQEQQFINQFKAVYDSSLYGMNNLSIFWMYNSYHPSRTRNMGLGEIIKDSVVLMPFAGESYNKEADISKQLNWVFYKGDTGKVLGKKVVNEEIWFYIEMPIKRYNSPANLRKGWVIYGWTKKENIRIKKFNRL